MKKVAKRMLCILLMVVMLLSAMPSISINAENLTEVYLDNTSYTNECAHLRRTGDLEIGNDSPSDIFTIKNIDDYNSVANDVGSGKKAVAVTSAQTVPAFVDNSTSPFFPKIGDQGGLGACCVFATVYYQFTYEMNKHRNVPTTDDNIFSVKWNYNLINNGKDVGSTAFENYRLIEQHGCPFNKSFPYDGVDYKGWCTEEKVWREAIRYRIKDYQRFEDFGYEDSQITTPDDDDLLTVKTALNNGEVLKFSSYIYSWDYDRIKTHSDVPENDKYEGEQFVRVVKGYDGGHGMAMVGYNDNIWCDINKNDKVDPGEMGAFKIANSWGEGYGNKGFIWIAYDALNKVSVVDGVEKYDDKPVGMDDIYRITVCDPYEGNDIYAKFTLNTVDRTQFTVKFFADKDGTEYSKHFLSSVYYGTTENQCAFDGTNKACDATFVCPLNDLDPEISKNNFESYNFYVTVTDKNKDSKSLTIKNVSIVNEHTGKEYKVNDSFPKVIDGGEYTNNIKTSSKTNAVIYYIGYDNPTLHYKKSGSSTFTKVKMEENDERRGSLYKYVIEDITGDVTLYFSDDSGKVDNNSGFYYTANEGLNSYYTKNQREEFKLNDFTLANGIPDLGMRCDFNIDATGGYEPYQYSYVIEHLQTGTVKECDYNYNYLMSPYSLNNEGTYRVTITAMDYAKETSTLTKEFEVINHPFEISSVTLDRENPIVSKNIQFSSVTAFEGIASWGGYSAKSRFVITDSNSKVWCDEVVKYHSYNTKKKTTTTLYNFIPHKAGEYTLTVSSTDCNKEYAEKTIRFTVNDMITGDTDGSGDITIMDATDIQRYLANQIDGSDIYLEMADCDRSEMVDIMDATYIQCHLAHTGKNGYVGDVIEYIPPTEPETQPPTVAPTDAPKVNSVTFTNSFSWGGTIYCYYWSDADTAMTSWPGVAMKNAGSNDFGEALYTLDLPQNVSYIIFTNGSTQTTDIAYSGGEVKYYPLSTTDSNGHNLVQTW